jgi:hypothetical protein
MSEIDFAINGKKWEGRGHPGRGGFFGGRLARPPEVKPETGRLVRQEIESGHIRSIVELIAAGVHAVRARTQPAAGASDTQGQCTDAATRIRELRRGVTLGGLRIRDLAQEGHRF